MPIALPRTVVNKILAHAQREPEAEVCGLIGAHGGCADTVFPVPNVAGDPGRLFAMEPRGQIDAMRAIRESGGELFAIYHSHPHAPPEPSAADLEQAAYPEALYLIVSLDTKGVLQMNGFRLCEGEVEREELEVV